MSAKYHKDEKYIAKNRQLKEQKEAGVLTDTYTGQTFSRNAKTDLDHIISAKNIHDDPGRCLARLSGIDIANIDENLCATDRSINRSKKADSITDFSIRLEANRFARNERLEVLKNRGSLTDKEQKELNKLEKLNAVDIGKMKRAENNAQRTIETKIAKQYYLIDPRFRNDVMIAAGKRGVQLGVRQALGFC